MPYRLIMIDIKDNKMEIRPLTADNPKSEFGLEDRTIERKGKMLAKKLEKFDDVKKCYIQHY